MISMNIIDGIGVIKTFVIIYGIPLWWGCRESMRKVLIMVILFLVPSIKIAEAHGLRSLK